MKKLTPSALRDMLNRDDGQIYRWPQSTGFYMNDKKLGLIHYKPFSGNDPICRDGVYIACDPQTGEYIIEDGKFKVLKY